MNVWLVDDHAPFRQSTVLLLRTAGLSVREFESADAVLAALPVPEDCCIVSDVRMPGMNGLELLDELRRRQIPVPLIFITGHGDVSLAVAAMRRGAVHFVEKPFALEVLTEAIRDALRKPEARRLADERLDRLTPRERQVLDLVLAGKLNKTIADVLGISIKTVELHRANMMNKLGVRNLPDLVRLCLEAA